MKNYLYLFPFNSKIEDICDYAKQTMGVVSEEHDVLGFALSNPISLIKDIKLILKGEFFVKSNNILILRPIMFLPFQRSELIKRLNIILNIFLLSTVFLFKRKKIILWFFEPKYLSLFLRFLRKEKSVFDCVDYFFAYENWQREQIYCLEKSDFVAVNSKTLKKEFSKYRKDIEVVPLGFAIDDMPTKNNKFKKKKNLTFGFIGAIGKRIDLRFLKNLVKKRSNDSFIFIGPQVFSNKEDDEKKAFSSLVNKKNVTWVDNLSRKKAWKYAEKFDIGLIPYSIEDDFNLYSFPMKLMEYFYAGLPVVSTPIEELKFYKEFVYIWEEQSSDKVDEFLKHWDLIKSKQQRDISINHTWKKKVSKIQELLLN